MALPHRRAQKKPRPRPGGNHGITSITAGRGKSSGRLSRLALSHWQRPSISARWRRTIPCVTRNTSSRPSPVLLNSDIRASAIWEAMIRARSASVAIPPGPRWGSRVAGMKSGLHGTFPATQRDGCPLCPAIPRKPVRRADRSAAGGVLLGLPTNSTRQPPAQCILDRHA
jgi:hypothetical protein